MKCFKIACLHSSSDKAKKSFTELNKLYSFVPPENADVILALGGDGFLLHTIHNYLNLNKPIFGMNCGTVGFLMNDYQAEGLTDRLKMAMQIRLFPLMMQAETRDEKTVKAIAFNEVAVTRHSGQTANIKVFINDVVRLEKFMGDGLILSTAAGSTAYNLSANGPIIPLESKLLALTPVSPFRPRRWRGALLPGIPW
jgi:NAD+ kinase